MRTYNHGILGYLLCVRGSDDARKLAAIGALHPITEAVHCLLLAVSDGTIVIGRQGRRMEAWEAMKNFLHSENPCRTSASTGAP